MHGIRNRHSCRDYLKKPKILPLQSQYLFSLLMSVVTNMNHYRAHSEVHRNNNRQGADLYQPFSRLSIFQRGTFYIGITVFNGLPTEIKKLIVLWKPALFTVM
jgi:hypothetical protein